MKKYFVVVLTAMITLSFVMNVSADQTITAKKVATAPAIDGKSDDAAWSKAKEITTHDNIADLDMKMKAVYTDTHIYFKVTFSDADETNTHKSWIWNKDLEMYKKGWDREDTFAFKFNMGTGKIDLSLSSDDLTTTDIWFWKGCRTNAAGYADDKTHILSADKLPKSAKRTSKSGKTTYLVRKGDSGTSAYKGSSPVEYTTDVVKNYSPREPSGSRADIKAKGVWADGQWTIELARKLNTGNADDVVLDPSKSTQFAVSRYEIAGQKPDPRMSQPYTAGDTSENLTLEFAK